MVENTVKNQDQEASPSSPRLLDSNSNSNKGFNFDTEAASSHHITSLPEETREAEKLILPASCLLDFKVALELVEAQVPNSPANGCLPLLP